MRKTVCLHKKFTTFFCILFCLFTSSNFSWGQTNPAAFALSGGNFSFTSQTATSTSYPANMQGWSTSANNIVGAETAAPGIDQTLVASGTSSTSGISNLGTNGFQFLAVSTTNSVNRLVGSICVAVNTAGRQDVKATWTAADQSTGASALRIMALTLQYRIGTSGTFTTVANSTYTTATSTAATAQTFSNVALPVECWNQAIVQLRWIYYEATSGQSGSRDPIRLDEITVSSSSGFSCPTFASTITVNPTSTPVVGSVYNKLSDVVGYLNNCSITQPIVIELSTNYVGTGESFPITLRAVSGMSSTNTITIRPATGATVNLSANVLSNPIISINGGTYWNIDGRAGGAGTTKSLTIENISTATLSPGILLINGAQYNTITYCNIKSASTSTTLAGTVAFSTSTASVGNSFNTVSYCNISDANTGTSTASITSSPTGTSLADARFNNNNTITYNNIYNFYNATSGSYLGAGILLTNGYNSDWTISNNSFYQTSTRTASGSGADFYCIYVNGIEGGNFTISNNYIGGIEPNCGSTPMTFATSATNTFRGIYFSAGSTSASTISNNVIKNISFTTATTSSVNAGISVLNGAATISNNTIGALDVDASSSPSINLVSGGLGSANFNGILAGTGTTSQGGITISNNSIGGIKCSSASTGPIVFSGIRIESGTGAIITAAQYNVTSNTIGSATTSNSLYNTSNNNIHGIYNLTTNTALANSITGNTIANLASNVTTPMITATATVGVSAATATVGSGGTASVSTYIVTSNNTLSATCGAGSNFVVSGAGFPTGSYISAYTNTSSYTITYPTQGSIPTLSGIFTVTSTPSLTSYQVLSGNTLNPACGYGSNFVVSGAGFPTGSYISAYTSPSTYTITYPTQGSIPTLSGSFTVTEIPQNQVIGFRNSSSSSACTFSNNTISNLSSNLLNPFANSSGTFSSIGIYSTTTAGGLFSGNTIHSLSGTNATVAQAVAGIYTTGQNSGTASIIEKNNIHSLFLATNSTSGSLFGIYENAYPLITKNNIIRLGTKNDGTSITTGYQISGIYDVVTAGATSIYFNSVYIGGTSVVGSASNTYALQSAGSTNARDYRNNLLFNARSNSSSSTGKNYAYRIAGTTSLTSDFNDIFANGTDGVLGYFGANRTTLSDWKTATSTDANSISSNPNFTSTTNLLPTSGTGLVGTSITGITKDFADVNRIGIPSMGAYEVAIPGCWTGTTDTDYGTTTNWDNATVPSSGDNIVIPSTVTNSPVLDANRTIGDLIIGTGKTININDKTLTINGAVSGAGTITGSASSILIVGGTAGTLKFTSGSRTLKDLSLTANATATLGTALDITAGITSGSVTVGTGATLATGDNLTLKSDANGTARVGNSDGTITGNVTVERYIPAKRAWRFLGVPLKGSSNNSIFYNWQNNGSSVANYGVELWSPTGTTAPSSSNNNNGMALGGATSIKAYNSTSNGWDELTNTNTNTLFDGTTNKAYGVFVTGPFTTNSTGNIYTGATATTLKATGTLIQGTHTKSLGTATAGQYFLVANPYASSVNPATITLTNIANNFYMWDPNCVGSYNVGQYTTYSKSADTYTLVGGGSGSVYISGTTPIQSGQAFFVQADAAAATAITFNETDKVSGSTNVFRTSSNNVQIMRHTLKKNISGVVTNIDGALGIFYNGANAAVDYNDAAKFSNSTENIVLRRANGSFAIEERPLVIENDTLFVRLTKTQQSAYTLELTGENFTNTPGLTATLKDAYTNTSLPLSITDTNRYNFTVDANAASTGDRFMIVFKTNGTLPVQFTNINATQKGAAVQVDWKVATEQNIKQYVVEKSNNGINFTAIATQAANNIDNSSYTAMDNSPINGSNYYRILSTDNSGKQQYSNVAVVKIGGKQSSISVYPNPVTSNTMNLQLENIAKGNYTIQLVNTQGSVVMQTNLKHAGGSSTQSIDLPSTLSSGNYVLKAVDEKGVVFTEKVVVGNKF